MRCRICGVDKPETEFSKQPKNKLGHLYQCKECCNIRYKKREPKSSTLVRIVDDHIICKTCGRSLHKSRMIKQYGNSVSEFQARCKDCDGIRKNRPDVWANRKNRSLIITTLQVMGKMPPSPA